MSNEDTQTSEQVSDVCEKCNEDNIVINELIQVLDLIQAMIEKGDNDGFMEQQRKQQLQQQQQQQQLLDIQQDQQQQRQLQWQQQQEQLQQLQTESDDIQSTENYQWYPSVRPNVVPGPKLYSKSHIRSTMVLSDSMSGRVNIHQVRRNIDTSEEEIIFKRYPGHTADEIRHYAAKPLLDAKPNQVIIIAGTNDIQRDVQPGRTVNEYQVVEDLMAVGRMAKKVGADKIFVSAVIVRHGHQYRNPVNRVNHLLQTRCSEEGFYFMDQSDISPHHISGDGVHLNFYGQTVLKMNILSCFNTFNPYFNDFEYDYERSLF